MNTLKIDKENIKGIGCVSGNIAWYAGFSGSLEEPPEPSEILEIDLTYENGNEVDAEAIFEDEVLLKALEDKVFGMLSDKDTTNPQQQ